jgi:hypothetical protein
MDYCIYRWLMFKDITKEKDFYQITLAPAEEEQPNLAMTQPVPLPLVCLLTPSGDGNFLLQYSNSS